MPVDVFGSGPHVVDAGARLGDRITVAVGAERERIRWALWTARKAREAAGLDPEALDIGAFVVVGVGTDQRSLDELVRGNASISAHFQRGVTSSLSASDATVVEEVTSRYDNYHHGLEHATQAEIMPEDFLSRFCVIGDPDRCTERLCELVDLGLSHLVIVGGSRDIDAAGFARHRRRGQGALGPPRCQRGTARFAGYRLRAICRGISLCKSRRQR